MAHAHDGSHDSNIPAKAEPATQLAPAIAAAFLVKFDNRKGYTVAWKQSENNLDVEGVVEFKSLPSGLHNVKEDLVYFVHEDFVGVSAFLNIEDDEAERNAMMLAVGVLVPLESGRMGKSWLHAEKLKELCRQQVTQKDDYSLLEDFWQENRRGRQIDAAEEGSHSPGIKVKIPKKEAGYQTSRSMSVGTVPSIPHHTLPPHHPALALPQMLHLFGPLILPLFRAALLRKRILILCEAPVEQACNFVYNLSVLSAIPRGIAESIALESTSDLRLQPLYNIGITDIPLLSARKSTGNGVTDSQGPGWIACTTDDVLRTKHDLFDILVILPSPAALRVSPRSYPQLIISSPDLAKAYPKYGLRASQRDAKRYRALALGVQALPSSDPSAETAVSDHEQDEDVDQNIDAKSIASSISSGISRTSVVEPQSWGRIAYTSLVWWASAGDKRAGLTEADENDDELDVALLKTNGNPLPTDEIHEEDGNEDMTMEVAIVSFFHRLSGLIFEVLGASVRRSNADDYEPYHDDDEHDEQGQTTATTTETGNSNADDQVLLTDDQENTESVGEQPIVEISQEDVAHMGLDVWSEADRRFLEEMISFWWGREATVLGGKIECCGIRLM